MKFEENLRELRKSAGLSQEDLADKLDVSRQSVSKWENGSAYPELDKLMQLCELFHCTLDELLKGEIKERPSLDKDTYEKQKKLERILVSGGAGLLITGCACYCLLEPLFTGANSMYLDIIFLSFVFVAVICFVTMGLKSSFFHRRYPQAPQQIYNEEEIQKVEHEFYYGIVIGIALMLGGIMVQQLLDHQYSDAMADGIFLLMIACAVMDFMYVSMKKSMVETTEPQMNGKSEHEERVSTYCGIIMIIATGAFFVWGFILHGWENSWLAFVFGGLACLIVSMLFKQKK